MITISIISTLATGVAVALLGALALVCWYKFDTGLDKHRPSVVVILFCGFLAVVSSVATLIALFAGGIISVKLIITTVSLALM
jgi:hypothetical protein